MDGQGEGAHGEKNICEGCIRLRGARRVCGCRSFCHQRGATYRGRRCSWPSVGRWNRVGGRVAGVFECTKLFVVDKVGARLAALADGTRSIEEAADAAGVSAADAASFFVTLGQAGYLQNEVYVSLCEVPA